MAVTAKPYTPNFFDYFEAAAQLGERFAQWKLGCCYLEGRFVAQDYELCKNWLLESSRHGFSLANRDLGYIFLYGKGTRPNKQLAIYYFRKAACACDPVSQFEFARLILQDQSSQTALKVDALYF